MSRSFSAGTDLIATGQPSGITGAILTVDCWIYPSVLTRGDLVASWKNGTTAGDQFDLLYGLTSGKPQFFVSSGSAFDNTATGPATLSTTAWHHVLGEYSASLLACWLDGVIQASKTPTISLGTSTTSVTIGNNAGNDGVYSGRIAEVTIRNVLLSTEEKQALAAGVFAFDIRPTSIVRYFALWGAHSPEPELSGVNIGATLTGTSVADHAPLVSTVWQRKPQAPVLASPPPPPSLPGDLVVMPRFEPAWYE